jgi:hypothetical protein
MILQQGADMESPVQPLATVEDFCNFAHISAGRQVRYRWEDIGDWVAERSRTSSGA